MPRAVGHPTSARAVASRVASITNLTALSKKKKLHHGSIPCAVLVYLFSDSQQRRVSRTRRAAVLPNRRVPPSRTRTRHYGLPFAQPKESQEVTTASLMVRRGGLGGFNRAYFLTPAG